MIWKPFLLGKLEKIETTEAHHVKIELLIYLFPAGIRYNSRVVLRRRAL